MGLFKFGNIWVDFDNGNDLIGDGTYRKPFKSLKMKDEFGYIIFDSNDDNKFIKIFKISIKYKTLNLFKIFLRLKLDKFLKNILRRIK